MGPKVIQVVDSCPDFPIFTNSDSSAARAAHSYSFPGDSKVSLLLTTKVGRGGQAPAKWANLIFVPELLAVVFAVRSLERIPPTISVPILVDEEAAARAPAKGRSNYPNGSELDQFFDRAGWLHW